MAQGGHDLLSAVRAPLGWGLLAPIDRRGGHAPEPGVLRRLLGDLPQPVQLGGRGLRAALSGHLS
eukprot:4626378-Alexandrium_andersonii.AAC.1